MRVPTIGPRDKRALTVGAAAIAALILATRATPLLQNWTTASVASAREVLHEAARAERSVAESEALRDSMRARGARLVALAPVLLDASSPSSAAATLASLLSGAAAASDAKLGAVQVRIDTARRTASSTFARVSVRADLMADVRGLSRFLLSLERGPTLLAIRELSVMQPEPGGDANRPEVLRIDVVVEGLALSRQAAPR